VVGTAGTFLATDDDGMTPTYGPVRADFEANCGTTSTGACEGTFEGVTF
jgi:hypothetical protein